MRIRDILKALRRKHELDDCKCCRESIKEICSKIEVDEALSAIKEEIMKYIPEKTYCETINQNSGILCEQKSCLSYNTRYCLHQIRNQVLTDLKTNLKKINE